MTLRIAMVAGEASGDHLAAQLIQSIRARCSDVRFEGIGGPAMSAQGFDAWWPSEKLSVMGLVEVLRHYRAISNIRKALRKRLLSDPPDLFIGVDAPDFNLELEAALKLAGIPTVHYVSPSIWAWRGKRVHKIGRSVSRVLALFPMEPPLYERAGVPVTFVGHPMADEIPEETDCAALREKLVLDPEAPVFALLPGSRLTEVRQLADTFLLAAQHLHHHLPSARFLVPFVTRETRNVFEAAIYRHNAHALPLRMMFGHARDAIGAANVCLVASGTATLETALIKRPMLITYRVSSWTYRLMRRMAYLPWIGLPNILSGRLVVPEFLQDAATPQALAEALLALYHDKAAQAVQCDAFATIHAQLRQGASDKAAETILGMLPHAARA